MVPVLIATVALILIFFFYIKSTLISTAYSSTENSFKKNIRQCEQYLQNSKKTKTYRTCITAFLMENTSVP